MENEPPAEAFDRAVGHSPGPLSEAALNHVGAYLAADGASGVPS